MTDAEGLLATLRVLDDRLPAGRWRWDGAGQIVLPDGNLILVEALPKIRDAAAAGLVGMRNELPTLIRLLEDASKS